MRAMRSQSKIAIVMPLYRQGTLACEAISSVLSQPGGRSVDIVIVDDGCPDLQSVIVGCAFAETFENIHYIRHENRGLSGARNRGIAFALENFPGCEALFFLDSDNRLLPFAIESLHRALVTQPDYDWFYPNITYFGLRFDGDHSGPYHVTTHTIANICEAGSLVRRRVFEAGVRFDERMRLGYEDWDFWLSAVERGFRGCHWPSAGFLYRKRPESMISHSARKDAEIREYMHGKHRWLDDPLDLAGFENREVPRFAIVLVDRGVVRLTSDPTCPGEDVPLAAFDNLFWSNFASPNVYAPGAILVIATEWILQFLDDRKLMRWAFHDLESRLESSNFSTIDIEDSETDRMEVSVSQNDASNKAYIVASKMELMRNICADASDAWICGLLDNAGEYKVSKRLLMAPALSDGRRPYRHIVSDYVNVALQLRSYPYSRRIGSRLSNRSFGTPDKTTVNFRLRERFGGAPLPPVATGRAGRVAFVLPMLDFGGVEKVSLKVAAEMKRCGFSPCLVLLGANHFQMAARVASTFDEIYICDQGEFEDWSGPDYQGTRLSRWSTAGDQAALANLLSSFEVVISCHSGDAFGAFGALKQRGVITAAYLHLFDRPRGRLVGHPMIAIAFEHATDLFVTCSHKLADQLRAFAVPSEKIVTVPNAAGCLVDPGEVEAIMRAREVRDGAQPLRVLYIGRMDAQKGIDRLRKVASRFAKKPELVEFRVVGKNIIDESADHDLDGYLEPPAYDEQELVSHYAWADVLLMPSRFEGLPLTIIEGMSFGVVPVATDVGAVSEVINDDVNGVLVPSDDAVESMSQAIERFAADRALLLTFAKRAADAGRARDWSKSVQPLLGAIESLKVRRAADRDKAKEAAKPDPR
jgi:glycosyltransferase involved in cell wall biosynthesis/GT2 family glycosyltransferase